METEKKYGTLAIEQNQLATWPNPSPERRYLVSMDIPEFTCVCPQSGFPDFAVIKIRYQPKGLIVELKSLKLYMNGFRDVAISHEAVVNGILDDLVGLLDPHWMRVTGDFNVRGNIKTIIRAEHGSRSQQPDRGRVFRDLPATPVSGLEGSASPPAREEAAHFLLLSGGLDSSTLAAWVRERRPSSAIEAVTFLYGQKHAVELEAARIVAAHYDIAHRSVALPPISGSALTDADRDLPEDRDLSAVVGVAPSYVPARNLLFLAFLASMADADGPAVLWLGVHRDDHTGYPDCRPEFVRAADEAVRLGTQFGLRVEAPFVEWRKADVLRWGLEHRVPYELTHSCYQGRRPACGVCDTCQSRLAAFREVGVEDPLSYATPTSG